MSDLAQFHEKFYDAVLKSYQRTWLDAILDGDTFILGSRRLGKSFLTSYAAILLAAGYRDNDRHIPGGDVVIISKDLRTAAEMIREVERHTSAMNILQKITHDTRGSTTAIWLSNGRKIMALPGLPKSARGLSGNVIVDEFAHNDSDPEELFAMATTIPSSDSSLRTVILTNADAQGSWCDNFLHSEDVTWQKRRSGFRILQTTVDDAYPDALPEHLQLQKDRLLPRVWQREYLCEFISGEDALFDYGSLLDGEPIETGDFSMVLAYDPGFAQDPAGWCVAKMTHDAVEVVDSGLAWEQPEEDQRGLIRGLVSEYEIAKILVDPGTAGYVLAANLQREHGRMVEKLSVNANRYSTWVRELQRLVNDKKLHISSPQREELIQQLTRLGEDARGKIIVPRTKAKNGRICHQDAAVALLMLMQVAGKVGGRRPMQPMSHLRRGRVFNGF